MHSLLLRQFDCLQVSYDSNAQYNLFDDFCSYFWGSKMFFSLFEDLLIELYFRAMGKRIC